MYDNVEYVAHIKTSKQALNHGLVHREIQFNQEEFFWKDNGECKKA